MAGIRLKRLTQTPFCSCSKLCHGYPTSYVVVVIVYNDGRSDVFLRFGEIGGIVDHHCLISIFIKKKKIMT